MSNQNNTIGEWEKELKEKWNKRFGDALLGYRNEIIDDTRNLLSTQRTHIEEERDKEWMKIIKWLMGEEGDFPKLSHSIFIIELDRRVKSLLTQSQNNKEV